MVSEISADRSSPTDAAYSPVSPQRNVLLPLLVKALVQPLGSENAWSELGDGRVEYDGYRIRVAGYDALQRAAKASSPTDGDDESPERISRQNDSVIDDSTDPHSQEEESAQRGSVIMEDTITDDTPFVGENSCIVWNSIDQELSMCMMFLSEVDFQAAWSALAALQHKPYPALGVDLLEGCRKPETPGTDGEAVTSYRNVFLKQYDVPLGAIEKHALALSLIENGHLGNAELYRDPEVCAQLLRFGHPDLIENLVAPGIYALLCRGLNVAGTLSNPPSLWTVPEGLDETLKTAKELEVVISTTLNLHHLKHDALPLGVEEEAIPVIDSVNHRLLNEAACSLLADDVLLKAAVQELDVLPLTACDMEPHPAASAPSTPTEAPTAVPGVVIDTAQSKELPAVIAEQHVANHLKFFTSIISLSITAFSKELVAPVMGKIFSHGLLTALSIVAERFTNPQSMSVSLFAAPRVSMSQSRGTSPESGGIPVPAGSSRPSSASGSSLIPTAPSTSGRVGPPPPKEGNGPRRPPRAPRLKQNFKVYSPLVEHELADLLDATMVRLNEKQEEVALNDFFRIPILEHPDRYAGLVHFLVRQLCAVPVRDCVSAHSRRRTTASAVAATKVHGGAISNGCSGSSSPDAQRRRSHDATVPLSLSGTRISSDMQNRLLLYHLLGMHDDEGSSSTERALDPDNDMRRHEFQGTVIRQYLAPLLKNPASGGAHSHASSGQTTPLSVTMPPGQEKSDVQEPITLTSSSDTTALLPPTLIRVVDYLLRLANQENRHALLTRLFDPSSKFLTVLEQRFKIAASHPRSFPINVLCEDVRLIKTIFSCFATLPAASNGKSSEQPHGDPNETTALDTTSQGHTSECHSVSSLQNQASAHEAGPHSGGQDAKLMSLVAKSLTLERPLFSLMLDVYHACGGNRKQGLLHCTIRSTLQTLLNCRRAEAETMRMYFMLKYRARLPSCFITGFEKRLLDDVVLKLDVHAVVGRHTDNLSPALGGVSHLDISAASSSPSLSPTGKYLSVDELATPPDAKQMEEIATFPRRLRQAIGRLSPTPRTSIQSELDDAATAHNGSRLEMPLLPLSKGGSSPLAGALAVSNLSAAASRPALEPLELSAPPPLHAAEKVNSDASTSDVLFVNDTPKPLSPSSPTLVGPTCSTKPSAPKQAKGTSSGRGSGRQLGDGKPLIRSK